MDPNTAKEIEREPSNLSLLPSRRLRAARLFPFVVLLASCAEAVGSAPGDQKSAQIEPISTAPTATTSSAISTQPDPAAWTSCDGRALVAGLSAQPLGQALDVESARTRLAADLGLIGHVQFLLRAGVGHGRPTTGRRGAAILV